MKIGRQAHRASAISTSNEATILGRGRDLCEELIGRISFTERVWLLVTGELPSEAQRRVLAAAPKRCKARSRRACWDVAR